MRFYSEDKGKDEMVGCYVKVSINFLKIQKFKKKKKVRNLFRRIYQV